MWFAAEDRATARTAAERKQAEKHTFTAAIALHDTCSGCLPACVGRETKASDYRAYFEDILDTAHQSNTQVMVEERLVTDLFRVTYGRHAQHTRRVSS